MYTYKGTFAIVSLLISKCELTFRGLVPGPGDPVRWWVGLNLTSHGWGLLVGSGHLP